MGQKPRRSGSDGHLPPGSRRRKRHRVQPGAAATWALPSAVVAALEMRKPSPFDCVHFMPAVDDAEVNGPRVIDWP